MAARPPVFNLLASLWTCDGNPTPAGGPADYEDVPVQKYIASKSSWPVSPAWANGFWLQFHPPVQLRFPRVPPFDVAWDLWTVTCAEVPQGSGQYYRLFWNDIQHEGFPNEYALMVAVQCNDSLMSLSPAGSTEAVGLAADPCGNTPPQDPIKPNIAGGLNCCSPSSPPPPVFFDDTFDGTMGDEITTHIADTGETWSGDIYGNMQLTGSGGVHDNDSTGVGNNWSVANYVGPRDQTLQMEFTTQTTTGASGVLLQCLWSCSDDLNFWLVATMPDGMGGHTLEVADCTGGFPSPVASSSTFTFLDSTDYVLVIVLSGSSVNITLLHGSTTDTTMSFTQTSKLSDLGVGIGCTRDSLSDDPIITHLTKA